MTLNSNLLQIEQSSRNQNTNLEAYNVKLREQENVISNTQK